MTTRIVSTLLTAASVFVCLLPLPTLAALGDCGQPQSTGSAPTATDALAVLKGAVGLASSCDAMPCICDVNSSGTVTSSDALQVLQAAVGQPVVLSCDCGPAECVTLSDPAAAATLRAPVAGLDVPPPQVLIETTLVGIDRDSFDQLGIGFDLDMSSPVTTDGGPAPGGTNGDGRTLAVDSNVTGGPPDLRYLLYGNQEADGALAILNENFNSPFTSVKTFFLLPPLGCVLFPETAVTEPANFPGVNPVENLAPVDQGLSGSELLYFTPAPNDTAALLAAMQSDSRNKVLTAPSVLVHSGQSVLQMVDDVEPSLEQIDASMRANIQAVTPNPFGNFTGVVLDIVPTISGNDISLEIRPASQVVSFFFSTAFSVNGIPVDAEIPVLRRSRNVSTIAIPSGDTVVIGGILESGQTMPEKGLPFLNDLPLIGSLFSHKQFDTDRQNLIVFVTARLVE